MSEYENSEQVVQLPKLSERASALTVGRDPGQLRAVQFASARDMLDFAEMMAKADSAVPPHLRRNVGNCLAIVVRAHELQMSPFALANWSYEVDNRGTRRIAYESQFYHAVIEARAPLKDRLHHEILGEGDERKCRVWATLRGESEPREFISDTLGKLRPPRGEHGVKGSPLWDKKPNLQLFYNASRDFARIYFPDVLAGLYTNDELEEANISHVGPDRARDVSPLRARLTGAQTGSGQREGFAGHQAAHSVIDSALAAAHDQIAEAEAPKRSRKTNPADASPEKSAGAEAEVAQPEASAAAPEANSHPIPPASGVASDQASSEGTERPSGASLPVMPELAEAYEHGRDGRRQGRKRSDVDAEYRHKTKSPFAAAWMRGWQDEDEFIAGRKR